jgi:hypothetical protein
MDDDELDDALGGSVTIATADYEQEKEYGNKNRKELKKLTSRHSKEKGKEQASMNKIIRVGGNIEYFPLGSKVPPTAPGDKVYMKIAPKTQQFLAFGTREGVSR